MKRNILFILALHIVVSLQAAIGLTKLTVEGRTEPLGLDVTAPRFGWQIASDKKNVMQEGYQLQVSTTPRERKEFVVIMTSRGNMYGMTEEFFAIFSRYLGWKNPGNILGAGKELQAQMLGKSI